MDKQEAELRRELQGTGVSVSRSGNQIFLNMPGDVTFATGSASIKSQHYATLNSVAKVLNKYDKTRVEIGGHTDTDGEPEANQLLSEARANAVLNSLLAAGIEADRMTAVGYGDARPVASNETAEGKRRNRRIEFLVAI